MSELSDRLRPSWAFDEALAGVVRELRLSHRHASANAANQYIVESNALRRLAAAELDAQSKLLAETVEGARVIAEFPITEPPRAPSDAERERVIEGLRKLDNRHSWRERDEPNLLQRAIALLRTPSPLPHVEPSTKRHAFTLNLTEVEVAALEELARKQDLSPQRVLIQGLRHYQLNAHPVDLSPKVALTSPVWGDVYRCDIGVQDIVDGLDQPDPSGSYVRLAITTKNGFRNNITISLGSADVLAAELVGLLSPTFPVPVSENADREKSVDNLMAQACEKRRHAAALITDAEVLEHLAYDAADYCGGGE